MPAALIVGTGIFNSRILVAMLIGGVIALLTGISAARVGVNYPEEGGAFIAGCAYLCKGTFGAGVLALGLAAVNILGLSPTWKILIGIFFLNLIPLGLYIGFSVPRLQVDHLTPAAHMTFKRVLIAVDASASAARAARVGIELARSLKARLAFVHVIGQALLASSESALPGRDLITLLENDAKNLLAKFRAKAAQRPAGVEFIRTGAPAAEILKVPTRWRADVIVMGTHGQGGAAEAVLRRALCPVLIERAKR